MPHNYSKTCMLHLYSTIKDTNLAIKEINSSHQPNLVQISVNIYTKFGEYTVVVDYIISTSTTYHHAILKIKINTHCVLESM